MISELSSFFHQKAILIVDDDFTSVLLLKEYLNEVETALFTASSCTEAKRIFIENPEIRLVLLDVRLADGCGIELSRGFKQIRTDVFIIAQTADAIDQTLNSSEGCNFDACLQKPINQDLLFKTIIRLIKG